MCPLTGLRVRAALVSRRIALRSVSPHPRTRSSRKNELMHAVIAAVLLSLDRRRDGVERLDVRRLARIERVDEPLADGDVHLLVQHLDHVEGRVASAVRSRLRAPPAPA